MSTQIGTAREVNDDHQPIPSDLDQNAPVLHDVESRATELDPLPNGIKPNREISVKTSEPKPEHGAFTSQRFSG